MPVYSPSWWGFRSPRPRKPRLQRLTVRCARSMASPWKEPLVRRNVQFSPVNLFVLMAAGHMRRMRSGQNPAPSVVLWWMDFLPDYTRSFPAGAEKQRGACNIGWQTRAISDAFGFISPRPYRPQFRLPAALSSQVSFLPAPFRLCLHALAML